MAHVDYFLKIDGIQGESQDDKHKGEIEIDSFSFGVQHPTTIGSATGGGGAGKAQFQDFHFTSVVSKASPQLFQKCATGSHFQKADLTMRKAGGDQQPVEFLKITLSDVLISSYQSAGSGHDVLPSDSFSLNFSKIEMTFQPQDTTGKLLPTINAGWDLKTNRVV